MTLTARLRSEQQFHDDQARRRAETFRADPSRLRFDDGEYLDHESWVRPAMDRLGDVRGRRVLDLGCGHGMAAVVLARRGAEVTATDLSAGYCAEAVRRAGANHVDVDVVQADAEQLPFADGSFDAVWGHAILHHLDIAAAARELRRILKPGGVVVVCEPWGENPLARLARNRLPYAGKNHTADEQPLRQSDVTKLADVFGRVEVETTQLFGTLGRVVRNRRLASWLDGCDRRLWHALPAVRMMGRYAVVTVREI